MVSGDRSGTRSCNVGKLSFGLIWKLFMNAPEILQGLKTRIYYFKIPSEREKSSKIKFCILVLIFNVFIRDNK